jgi:hypothetical protein
VRGKGSKLGEPCPKVKLSQDRLPILHVNVIRANVASSKCHSTTRFGAAASYQLLGCQMSKYPAGCKLEGLSLTNTCRLCHKPAVAMQHLNGAPIGLAPALLLNI